MPGQHKHRKPSRQSRLKQELRRVERNLKAINLANRHPLNHRSLELLKEAKVEMTLLLEPPHLHSNRLAMWGLNQEREKLEEPLVMYLEEKLLEMRQWTTKRQIQYLTVSLPSRVPMPTVKELKAAKSPSQGARVLREMVQQQLATMEDVIPGLTQDWTMTEVPLQVQEQNKNLKWA